MCVDLDQLEDECNRDNLISELVQYARTVPLDDLETLVRAAATWADGPSVTFHLLTCDPNVTLSRYWTG